MLNHRSSGLLMPIFCLPSRFGIGDLGPQAYQFANILNKNKQQFWQILPLNPTELEHGNSPYFSYSAFAGNPLLISPELLHRNGLLSKSDLEEYLLPEKPEIDFSKVYPLKQQILQKAVLVFSKLPKLQKEFADFCQQQAFWLEDYTLFEVLRHQFNHQQWNEWPVPLRERNMGTLTEFKKTMSAEIERYKIIQFLFFRQWYEFKHYCKAKNIKIIGDMSIYVTYQSAEVWTHPKLFKLDKNKNQFCQAGVPPDYFSPTGQLWGNPVYKWSAHLKENFQWWQRRIAHNLTLYDLLRIDHFRGLLAYWEIPAGEKTAIKGNWVNGGGEDFFYMLKREFPDLPFIAEDLGVITEDVVQVMNQLRLPGMRVLQFAFGESFPHSIHLPHNHITNCVVFTGTHDNNTIQGWWQKEIKNQQKILVRQYLSKDITTNNVHWEFIRLAQSSVANLAIIAVQDMLGLGEGARMNNPACTRGNWHWRLTNRQMSELKENALPRLKKIIHTYGRDKTLN
ncbi:MAG: 4-alpha-glucanotransferase [Atribacterota bacterium]|nr:4-alpha-glucanotransferase [Atribacterota bacterium]MDD4895885.1 4-alpha-glucanotransferase [Atribacterota bacterium]MDD5636511.1 4-alpha-glucanotransferase [Atribacterota bacterium]